jgi:phosphonoacetate hydrolase
MVDGFDPEYLETCPTPNLREMARQGFMVEAKGLMPSVTNVNNTSMVTASYPETHGITSNYWWDRVQDAEVYMESGEYIRAETIFQRAEQRGARSLLVTSKDKLCRLLGQGTTRLVSSEEAPADLVQAVGEPPPIYSLEVNGWIIDVARHILSEEAYDLVYLATTDYAMHTYAPEQPESAAHLALVDTALGQLMDSLPDAQILITADHGMSTKTKMIHLPEILARQGIQSQAVPIIKDRYTVHHSNLGGCIYVYLQNPSQADQAIQVLDQVEGVDEALSREQAALRFHLMPERIGDLMVLGGPEVVFGNPEEVTLPKTLRSHGSLHEDRVPIIGYGGDFDGFEFRENKDLGRYVFERVLR